MKFNSVEVESTLARKTLTADNLGFLRLVALNHDLVIRYYEERNSTQIPISEIQNIQILWRDRERTTPLELTREDDGLYLGKYPSKLSEWRVQSLIKLDGSRRHLALRNVRLKS